MANETSRDSTRNNANSQAGGTPSSQGTSASADSSRVGSDRERPVSTSRESGGQRGLTTRRQGALSSPMDLNDPFTTMRQMMDDMDRLVSAFGLAPAFGPQRSFAPSTAGNRGGAQRGAENTLWMPQMEMFERGNDLIIRADLPGLKKDDVDVQVENDTLVIQGERRDEQENRNEGLYRSERSYGTFYRAIPLPEGVDPDQVNARFQDGVLEITVPMPQQQQHKGRKISVQ